MNYMVVVELVKDLNVNMYSNAYVKFLSCFYEVDFDEKPREVPLKKGDNCYKHMCISSGEGEPV